MKINEPQIYQSWYKEIKPKEIKTIGIVQQCAIEKFFENNPEAKSCMMSCNCPKCRIHC